jgi:hypothetical protein
VRVGSFFCLSSPTRLGISQRAIDRLMGIC